MSRANFLSPAVEVILSDHTLHHLVMLCLWPRSIRY